MDKEKISKLLIFSSGSKDGGGSGFLNLVNQKNAGILNTEIVGVVSNHQNGGVFEKANNLNIPFYHFPLPREAEDYQRIVSVAGADFVALSGWLKLVKGLNPKTTFNIHPGPLPRFGGEGMYGHFVHEAVMEAYKKGEVEYSAVSMHFVTEKFDEGPLFFEVKVSIHSDDDAVKLAERVNRAEHFYQPIVTDAVVNGRIYWDGKNKDSLVVSEEFKNLPIFDPEL
jgi:phosphoribosylglycinamide formyltransferase 1